MRHLVVGPDHEDRPGCVIAALLILLQEAPIAARGPGVIVEHVRLYPRRPHELPRLVRLGDPEPDQRARGEVNLLLLLGQRLEVLHVLLVAGTVGGYHHRPSNGPHAQPELAPLGARQVELGGLGPHLRYRLGSGAREHRSLLACVTGSFTRILQAIRPIDPSAPGGPDPPEAGTKRSPRRTVRGNPRSGYRTPRWHSLQTQPCQARRNHSIGGGATAFAAAGSWDAETGEKKPQKGAVYGVVGKKLKTANQAL